MLSQKKYLLTMGLCFSMLHAVEESLENPEILFAEHATNNNVAKAKALLLENPSISRDHNVYLEDGSPISLLNYAIESGWVEMFNLLVERDGFRSLDLNLDMHPTNPALTIINLISEMEENSPPRQQYLSMLQTMLENGLSPDCIVYPEDDKSGKKWCTLLCAAASASLPDVTLLLLEAGATPDSSNCVGYTPLMIAAVEDAYRVANILLQHGANTFLTSNSAERAIDFARKKIHTMY